MKYKILGGKYLNSDIMKPSSLIMEYYYNFIFEGISKYKNLYKTYIKTELIQKQKEGYDIEEFFVQSKEIISNFKEKIIPRYEYKIYNPSDDFLEISLTELSKGNYVGSFYFKELNEFENSLEIVYHELINKQLVILKNANPDFYEIKEIANRLSKLPEDESPYIFLKTLCKEVELSFVDDYEALNVFYINFYDLIKENSSKFVFENHKAEIKEWFKQKFNPTDIELLWDIKEVANKENNDISKKSESQLDENKLEDIKWMLLIREDFHKRLEKIETKIEAKILKWGNREALIECAAFCELLFEKKYFVPKSTRIKSVNSFAIIKYGADIKNQLATSKKADREKKKVLLNWVFS